jgi:heterodisulfide reductase subunit A
MVPSNSFKKLNKVLGLQTSSDGFLKEYHARLNTVDSDVPGIVLAGAAHGPKSIAETIMQAKGAASSAEILLANGEYRISLVRAVVDSVKCAKCGMCATHCPYHAITIDLIKGAIVDEIACRGCGLCASICPSSAITIRYYRDEQYDDLIDSFFVVDSDISTETSSTPTK